MEPVQITPQASQDIAKLAQGVDRAQVALEALKDSRLTPAQVKQLKALLKTVSPTEGAASATKSEAVAELKSVDGHQAVVGKVTVNGQQLDTLLSEGSFNKSRSGQHGYAAQLGFRMATREENRAYVEGLLAKEGNDTINDAEKNALNTYRERYVRDTEGGLDVDGRRVRGHYDWDDNDLPCFGALFVRASAESK
jgi:Tfp pilus assembly protein FimT